MGAKKKSEKQLERDLIRTVNKNGWQVQMVYDPEGVETTFAYTIGIAKTLEHPEIICFGLKPEVMHRLLNGVGKLISEGADLVEGRDYNEFLQDYPIRFKKVHPSHFPDYVNWAMWFNDFKPFEVLQLFWPDKEGYFPWDENFNPRFLGIQPFLFKEKR